MGYIYSWFCAFGSLLFLLGFLRFHIVFEVVFFWAGFWYIFVFLCLVWGGVLLFLFLVLA